MKLVLRQVEAPGPQRRGGGRVHGLLQGRGVSGRATDREGGREREGEGGREGEGARERGREGQRGRQEHASEGRSSAFSTRAPARARCVSSTLNHRLITFGASKFTTQMPFYYVHGQLATLKATQGQILRQSPTDTTSGRWHLNGN